MKADQSTCVGCGQPLYGATAATVATDRPPAPQRPGLLRRLLAAFLGPPTAERVSITTRVHIRPGTEAVADPAAPSALESGGTRVFRHTKVINAEQAHWIDPATGEAHVSGTLADLPDWARAEIEKHLNGLRTGDAAAETTTTTSYSYRDSSGVERSYRSLDEMPPEVRRVFEHARAPVPAPRDLQ